MLTKKQFEDLVRKAREYVEKFVDSWHSRMKAGAPPEASLDCRIYLSGDVSILRVNIGKRKIMVEDRPAAHLVTMLNQRPENAGLFPLTAPTTFAMNTDASYVVLLNTIFDDPNAAKEDGAEYFKRIVGMMGKS